ncbi:hypothetical protein NFI96_020224, partial [Prochilodus magdalenae]
MIFDAPLASCSPTQELCSQEWPAWSATVQCPHVMVWGDPHYLTFDGAVPPSSSVGTADDRFLLGQNKKVKVLVLSSVDSIWFSKKKMSYSCRNISGARLCGCECIKRAHCLTIDGRYTLFSETGSELPRSLSVECVATTCGDPADDK